MVSRSRSCTQRCKQVPQPQRSAPPTTRRIYRGLALWGETVRTLRDQLAPAGWKPEEADNFPTVVRGDGALAIAVASGSAGHGEG